jgi:hypothetical protein
MLRRIGFARTTFSKDNRGQAHEEKGTRQTLLGLRPGHDVDVTVNFLA